MSGWCYKLDAAPQGVVQTRRDVRTIQSRTGPFTLPEHILRLAHAEYARRYPGQDFESIQGRHGFGLLEVVGLLADLLDRLGAVPSPQRQEADK